MSFHARWSRLFGSCLMVLAIPLVALGSPGDRVLVSGWNSNNVLGYDETGSFTGALVTARDGLSLAHSLTIGPDGYIYITSFGTDTVIRYDAKTATNLGVFVTAGLGGLNGPSNAVFGPDGRLYVTGLLSNSIHVYDGSNGASLGTVIAGLNGAESVLFNADGNLLLVSGPGNTVLEYDTAGVFQGVFVSPGNGLSNPHDGVFGPNGNFYLSAFGTNKVLAYDGSTGTFIEVLVQDDPGTPAIDESGGLTNAHGLLFGRDGDLYVTSFGSNEVLRYDGATGEFLDVFVTSGNGLSGPTDVLFPITGDIDGDGVVGITDFLELLGQWGACAAPCPPACLADLDGDCAVGILDFLALLSNWG